MTSELRGLSGRHGGDRSEGDGAGGPDARHGGAARAADAGGDGRDAGPPAGGDFRWMTGFECSMFPQVGMDELALTQHDRFWGSDLLRVVEAGCRTLRYGIRWHIVNPAPQVWDWTSVDGPMELMRELGIEPIVDLFHFGVPAWMGTGVMTSIFPDFQAELCASFARRYPWVRWYTPTNEPYIMSQFGGETGAWYPYEHGPHNFVRALRNVGRGLVEGWAAIREVRSDARLMVSDTCEYWHALDDGVKARADLMNERRFMMHELYGGRLGRDHGLWGWLVDHGFAEDDLRWFLDHPAELDVVGLDHYPHSEHELRTGDRGQTIDEPRALEQQLGPAELCRQYSSRLGRPMLFAETGAPGDDATKIAWMDRLVSEVRQVRSEGIPLIGITWWGLLDQVDWGSGLRRFRYEIDPTGLYRLEWRDDRNRPIPPPDPPRASARDYRLERIPTEALTAWQRYTSAPVDTTVGPLATQATRGELVLW